MSSMPSHNSDSKMNKTRLLSLAERLKVLAVEIENELKEDVGSYVMSNDDYAEILKYVETNDDDGEEGL